MILSLWKEKSSCFCRSFSFFYAIGIDKLHKKPYTTGKIVLRCKFRVRYLAAVWRPCKSKCSLCVKVKYPKKILTHSLMSLYYNVL